MAEPLATVQDLVGVWRPLTADEQTRAGGLLGAASAMLRAEIPGVDDAITAGTVDAELVRWVVCQMVRRVMLTPDSPPVTQQAQSLGQASISWSMANPGGDMYLTRSERRMLGGGRQRAATISMIPGVPDDAA